VFTARYRRKLDYSDASIDAAAAALASLRARLRALGPPSDGPWAAPRVVEAGPAGDRPEGTDDRVADRGTDRAHDVAAPLSAAGRTLHDRFVAALDDDLDLPTALAVVRETLRADLPADERRWLALDADAVLGLDLHRAWDESRDAAAAAGTAAMPDAVASRLAHRAEARDGGDFARADALRSEIEALGWEVVDGPAGSTAKRRG
jgi:cysteinyl-tRNA synthetase